MGQEGKRTMDEGANPEEAKGRQGMVISAELRHRAVLGMHRKCWKPLRLPISRALCHFSQFNLEFLFLVTNPREAHQRDLPVEKAAAIREEQ